MKIGLGKSKFHEGELDCTELHAFPNSEHMAERNICRPLFRRRQTCGGRQTPPKFNFRPQV